MTRTFQLRKNFDCVYAGKVSALNSPLTTKVLATHIASTITIVEFLKKVLVVSLQVVRKEHLSISNYFRISASASLNQPEKPHTILHIILRLIIFLVFYWLRLIYRILYWSSVA